MSQTPTLRWEPALHLIWLLPCLSLAALGVLLTQAGSSAGTEELDRVSKMTQIQTYNASADLSASARHLHAQLRMTVDPLASQLQLRLWQGGQALRSTEDALIFGFIHPTQGSQDHWLHLKAGATPGVWSQSIQALLPDLRATSRWRVVLFPSSACAASPLVKGAVSQCLDSARWQLHGTLLAKDLGRETLLEPRFASLP